MSVNKAYKLVPKAKIRHEIVETLKNADTEAGKNVVSNATHSTWIEEIPAISVNTVDERSEIFEESPKRWKKTLTLDIQCKVKDRKEGVVSDKVDFLVWQVEQALAYREKFDDDFRCLFESLEITSASVEFEKGAQEIVASGSVQIDIVYIVGVSEKQPRLVDLETVNAEFSVGADSENSTDQFSVPTV